ncbi:MAG TPA: SRPBCC domain-containing protein, partial [Bacteroidia bacterium]|nr:SRPBCC domain-containing protein [Bacteroidia bacterium]
QRWTTPADIMHWNNASDDWHTPSAANDLRVGGQFSYRMEAKDGSFGFDFNGVYDRVEAHSTIEYSMEDGRRVRITFVPDGDHTVVTETFDAETENSLELQQTGWQMILNNFKAYAESL